MTDEEPQLAAAALVQFKKPQSPAKLLFHSNIEDDAGVDTGFPFCVVVVVVVLVVGRCSGSLIGGEGFLCTRPQPTLGR